jgi:hypothetical protein
MISLVRNSSTQQNMREWLSGGVSPCQGEGRGFESRLALKKKGTYAKHRFFSFSVSRLDAYSHKLRLRKNKNGGSHADILVLPMALRRKDAILTSKDYARRRGQWLAKQDIHPRLALTKSLDFQGIFCCADMCDVCALLFSSLFVALFQSFIHDI